MRKTFLVMCLIFAMLLTFVVSGSWAQKPSFTVGFVSDGDPKPNAAEAYKWGQSKYNGAIIPVPKARADLEKYGVIWWDESNGAAIPVSFTDKAVIDAFLGYVESGGGLLLSSLAFHYLFEMGLEDVTIRYFGANAAAPLEWTDFQISDGQENHAIFKGMKAENNIIQYDILGYAEGSDFWGANGPVGPDNKDAKVLAQTIEGQTQCNGVVEYQAGSGTIIVVGWVWSSWVINKKLEDIHGPLHANIINYLATKSKYAAVDSAGKLTATWGSIKSN